jgi:hypothetical protein
MGFLGGRGADSLGRGFISYTTARVFAVADVKGGRLLLPRWEDVYGSSIKPELQVSSLSQQFGNILAASLRTGQEGKLIFTHVGSGWQVPLAWRGIDLLRLTVCLGIALT